MSDTITWVGLDAHKAFIQVAMLLPGKDEPVEWTVGNPDDAAIRRLGRKLLDAAPGELRCCYEASNGGFDLKRRLEKVGPIVCEVIAPSLIPVRPGDRVKTDRRDACKLARLYRADELTVVGVPTREQENTRDLCRMRDCAREDLTRARHRLVRFLMRRGLVYRDGRHWTCKHARWVHSLCFDDPVEQYVFDTYVATADERQSAIGEMDAIIATVAETEAYAVPVKWLSTLRGVEVLSALVLTSDLLDVSRFSSPRNLMGFLGLTPTEHSSGGHRRTGRITKAGNAYVRRMLVEIAWAYSRYATAASRVHRRRADLPAAIVQIGEKADRRLYGRYWSLTLKGKSPQTAATAVARELVGFVWNILREAAEHPTTTTPRSLRGKQ